jgi:hypothetical protein
MRAAILQLMAASAGTLAVIAAPSCTTTCEETGTCGTYSPDEPDTGGSAGSAGKGGASGSTSGGGSAGLGGASGASGTGGSDGGSGGEGGEGPDPCDPLAPDDGCAIGDPDGIYVAPSGSNAAEGTREAPFETITEAIEHAAGTGRTIYVCNGAFDEHLEVSEGGLVIRGGYDCPSATTTGWIYRASERPRVRPPETGYALHVAGVDGLTISDFELVARDADEPGASSVTVFVNASENVSFERTRIVAGNGVDGASGAREGSNHNTGNLDGNGAIGAAGGQAEPCVCGDGSTSTGAAGGAGGLTPTAGAPGLPNYGMGGGTRGEASTLTSACTNGGLGASAPSRMDANGASEVGTIAATGWVPGGGTDGTNGQPAQGGGGGGGGGGLGGKGGGGGGACGGCGGKGGPAGGGGGGTIGLLALDSYVTLDGASAIETGNSGNGGAGAASEPGQNGGTGGNRDGQGCLGGNGGKGAAGGAGGGGAGGVSVGILSKGGAITADGVTFTIGDAGIAGRGGGADNDGVAGLSADTLEL